MQLLKVKGIRSPDLDDVTPIDRLLGRFDTVNGLHLVTIIDPETFEGFIANLIWSWEPAFA